MSEAGRLEVIVEANIVKLNQDLQRANERIAGFSARAQKNFDDLKRAIDPIGAAAEAMERSIRIADNALKAGLFTTAQHTKALALAEAEYKRVKDAAEGAARGHRAHGDAAGFSRTQLLELTHVARASFDALAAGANPLRVIALESGRVGQALGSGQGGLAGGLRALAGLVLGPVAGFLALGAAVAGAIFLGERYAQQERETEDALRGIGAASGETVKGLDAIADSAAKAGTASRDLALEAERAFLHAGATSENLAAGVAVLRDFAAMSGEKVPDALKKLALAYADPKKFTEEFGGALLNLTGAQIDEINRLAEMGDKAASTSLLIKDIGEASKGAARDLRNGLGQALDDLKIKFGEFAASFGQLYYNLTHTASPAQQLQQLQARRAQMVELSRLPGHVDARLTVADIDRQIAQLPPSAAQGADPKGVAAAAAKRGREVRDLVDSADPYDREIRQLRNQRDGLKEALANPGAGSDRSPEDIRRALTTVENRIARQEHRRDHVPGQGRTRRGPEDQTTQLDASATQALDRAAAGVSALASGLDRRPSRPG